MDISHDIFIKFFKKLEEDQGFPDQLIEVLKNLLNEEGFISKDDLFKAMREVDECDIQD